ncbi:hypothetical protein [Megalodesulfovibrio paquesii]
MTTQTTAVQATAASARRGVVARVLGAGRVEARVGEARVQAMTDAALVPGQHVLVMDWPGGAVALPLSGLGGAEHMQADEVICNHV